MERRYLADYNASAVTGKITDERFALDEMAEPFDGRSALDEASGLDHSNKRALLAQQDASASQQEFIPNKRALLAQQ
ncbi:MAG: hypothetical protein KBS77_06645 [Bacteroidales bacterium]|nr:hypothetical protein [Candidatus Colicola faecequi]